MCLSWDVELLLGSSERCGGGWAGVEGLFLMFGS